MLSIDDFTRILKHGTYYNPAHLHYDNPNCLVACDKCNKTNLTIAIGYDKYDLCLLCVDTLSNNPLIQSAVNRELDPSLVTFMMQDTFEYKPIPSHIQYNPNVNKLPTRMMQDVYKRKLKQNESVEYKHQIPMPQNIFDNNCFTNGKDNSDY